MKTNNLLWALSFVAVVVMFAMIGIHWNDLPAEVPMHFNLAGEADRYGSKSELLLLPGIGGVLWLLCRWITKRNVKVNPNKWGSKTPQQLEISKDLIAEITLYTMILLALGVYEIMNLAVHGNTVMNGYMFGFALIGIVFVLVRFTYRISRSS